jgi:hypothetical protein
MHEIWKDVNVEEFSHLYQVSNLGNVRSLDKIVIKKNKLKHNIFIFCKGKIKKQSKHNHGYSVLSLANGKSNKQFFVHRLVALTFIPNDDSNKKHINHINGIKNDNRVENLEWTNASLNAIHAVSLGLIKSGKDSKLSKPIYQINASNGEIIARFGSIRDVERRLGYLNTNIGFALKDKGKTAYGFKWQYA